MILHALDMLAFTIERIRQHIILVLWVLAGITVAVTLALSLPLYVDAVYTGILESRLDNPPYAYQFRYLGAWNGNIALADVDAANAAIENQFADAIDLPAASSVRYMSAGRWTAQLADSGLQLGAFPVSALTGAESLIHIADGTWPPEADDERVPVLLPETARFTYGVQVGDELILLGQGGQIEAYIAALWRPVNETDPQWIFPPRFFEQVMLVPPDTLQSLIAAVEDPIDEVDWYLIFDGTDLRTSEIDRLLNEGVAARVQVERVLPGISLTESPESNLAAFNAEVDTLTRQLFIIIMPVGGLVLYFVSVVAGLLVRRQQTDDVKLRTRGMSRGVVLAIHVLMWALIVLAALVSALILSPLLVQLIGRTVSFLDFSGVTSVQGIVLTTDALLIALGAGFVAASSGLLLAWRITLQNINSLKRVNKGSDRAWWQRTYLDLLAVGLAAYVLYTLLQQNGIDTSADTPFADPLTFIGPTLFALGLTLLFLRLLPVLLNFFGRVFGLTSNIPLLMAFRELTRSMGRYRGTLLMTAFTLSLAGFTASMASTLDQSLLDVIRYRVGADLKIVTITDAETESTQDAATGATSEEITGFNAPPVLDLIGLEEIADLSRVGQYEARMTLSGQRLTGVAIGVDRAGLGGTAFMRADFSDVPLGNMLNELATNRTGVILNQQVADAYNIVLGQEVRYQVSALGEWQSEIRAVVVGFIEYFPTIDPVDYDFFLITSIAPIFEVSGTPLPFNVWANTVDNMALVDVEQAIRDIGFPVLRFEDPDTQLRVAQAEPGRRGVLGFLSVGFVAAIALTLIGAVIQSTASFQEQSAQLGSMRAMGMSSLSVRLYVLALQGLIVVSGVGSGTLIGLATTTLFLPLFDFSGGLPPYQLRIAWDEIMLVYGAFGSLLAVVALFMALILTRQQLIKAVKLGNI